MCHLQTARPGSYPDDRSEHASWRVIDVHWVFLWWHLVCLRILMNLSRFLMRWFDAACLRVHYLENCVHVKALSMSKHHHLYDTTCFFPFFLSSCVFLIWEAWIYYLYLNPCTHAFIAWKLIQPFSFLFCEYCTYDSIKIAAISIVNLPVNGSVDFSNTLYLLLCTRSEFSSFCCFF